MAYSSTRKKTVPDLTLEDLIKIVLQRKNGRPNYGFIISYYRMLMGWTAEVLASCYGEALGIDHVTPNWIYLMENQNRVPTDEKRRWILARLLDIPPLLLGLKPANALLVGPQEDILNIFSRERVDIAEYRAALEGYCSSKTSGKIYETIPDLKRRIHNLHYEIHYLPTSSPEKQEMLQLLCEYLAFLAIVAHEQQRFDLTIALLSDAIFIAKENKLYDVWAYALRQRGAAYLDRGELTAGLIDFTAAQPDFDLAVADFEAIKEFESHLSPSRKGLVDVAAGLAYAHVAQDEEQLKNALQLIDDGANGIGKDGERGDTTIAARLDQERYHLNRGMVLMISPNNALRRPAAAREEFERALKVGDPNFKRRQLENNIRQADCYFIEGQFPKSKHYYPDEFFTMALGHAEAALEILKDIDCDQDLTRLENLYRGLRESIYGKSEDVAQFGVALMKVRQPQIFH